VLFHEQDRRWFVHSLKRQTQGQKIDLHMEYPCPCRRKARLIPIVLTEALGCDRCPNVFVVTPDGEQVEQVAGLLLSRRLWRWTGQQWVIPNPPQQMRDKVLVGASLLLLTLILSLPGQWAIWGCVLGVVLCPMLVDVLRRWLVNR
jgi:hypothetical protein